MDLPDPIGWQLERKQRENGREKSRRKLVRQRQPSLEVAGGDEGMGKGSGREERDEKGKVEGKKLEMGRGQSFMGAWGKAGGSPQPATHAILSHNTRQCTHSSRHVLSPSDIPLLWSSPPCLSTHWPGAIPSLRGCGTLSPTQQPPGLMEKDRKKKEY